MERLHFSAVINAPKQKVWETMLNDATYREWTAVFNPGGSFYEGKWETGADMRFYGPDQNGVLGGMISKIKEARPYDFVSIQHVGEMSKGQERMYTTEEQGNGLFENYTLIEKDGATEVLVDLDILAEYKDMMADLWPKALEKLKEMAER